MRLIILHKYIYDKDNRLWVTIDSGNDITITTYDDVGNVGAQCDGESNTTYFEYDEFNRLVKVTDPESTETTYTYDLNGNLLTQTDGEGNVKTYEYNACKLFWSEALTTAAEPEPREAICMIRIRLSATHTIKTAMSIR